MGTRSFSVESHQTKFFQSFEKKTSVSLASVGKAFREIRYSSYLGMSRVRNMIGVDKKVLLKRMQMCLHNFFVLLFLENFF